MENLIWVWQGPNVLKNYRPGVAVIAASDEAEAWEKLKVADTRAYLLLWVGDSGGVFEYSEEELDYFYHERTKYGEPKHEPGFPIRPVSYTPDTLPIIVMHGGS